jgi:di/tricarboxylate transporter
MRAAILGLMIGLVFLPGPALATPTAREVADATLDLVIFRPLQVAAFAIGATAFVPAALLTAPNGLEPIKQTWDQLAGVQVKPTFRRKLGAF